MAQPSVSVRTYLVVYAALLALLALTIGLSYVHIGPDWNTLLALLIAVAKALLVALFFMHLKYGSRLLWFFALGGAVWLGILLVLGGSEYVTRNRPVGVNPKGEPVYLLTRSQ